MCCCNSAQPVRLCQTISARLQSRLRRFHSCPTRLTTNATSTPPDDSCSSSKNGIWYSFTPATTVGVFFSTCNASAPDSVKDTVMTLWESADGSCESRVRVACNDDYEGCAGGRSAIGALLHASKSYHVEVARYGDSSSGTGKIQLAVLPPSVESNFCAGAVAVDLSFPWFSAPVNLKDLIYDSVSGACGRQDMSMVSFVLFALPFFFLKRFASRARGGASHLQMTACMSSLHVQVMHR